MTAPADDRRIMLIALAGASLLSFAPLLYIQSETTPITGAFFRMVYAIHTSLVFEQGRHEIVQQQDAHLCRWNPSSH